MTEEEFKNQATEALRWYQKKHRKEYTQRKIGDILGRHDSTISKYLAEEDKRTEMPWQIAVDMAEAMDTNLWTVMYLYEQQEKEEYEKNCTNLNEKEKLKNVSSEFENLIVDANDSRFKPWIGKYYCYFSSTSSSEINGIKKECKDNLTEEQKKLFNITPSNDHIFCGRMTIDSVDDFCRVSLEFMADKEFHNIKHYEGRLYLSVQYAAGFIELSGRENSECSYIILNSPDSGKLECRMAMALTLSSIDRHRRACAEKILISKKRIAEATSEYEALKAYLRMNDSLVHIKEEEYYKLIDELKKTDVTELQNFANTYSDLSKLVSNNSTIEVCKYVTIPESIIQNLKTLSKENKTKLRVCLRNHSMANWYYKANNKNAEDILNIINKRRFVNDALDLKG